MQKGEASTSKIKYRATRKLEIGKLSHFHVQLGFGFGGQSDWQWNERQVLYEEEGTV